MVRLYRAGNVSKKPDTLELMAIVFGVFFGGSVSTMSFAELLEITSPRIDSLSMSIFLHENKKSKLADSVRAMEFVLLMMYLFKLTPSDS